MDKNITDNQYTIRQAVEKTGVGAHTLRYYERIGLLKPVAKAENGHRRYSEDDLHWVHFLTLLRVTDMPIEQMKIYVELERQGPHTDPQRLLVLETHRTNMLNKIAMLTKSLTAIDHKIDVYKGVAATCIEPGEL